MRQMYFDKAVYTTFIITMCCVNVLSIQQQQQQKYQHQHQHRRNADESSSMTAKSGTFTTSSIINENLDSTQKTWQPMSQNNWIILEAAATPTANNAATATRKFNNQRETYRRNGNVVSRRSSLLAPSEQLKFQYWRKEQQIPTNYYTYNQSSSSNGNIHTGHFQQQPLATDVKLIEPYIVTISKMRNRNDLLTADALLTMQRNGDTRNSLAIDAPPYAGGIKLTKDVVSKTTAAASATPFQQDIKQTLNNTITNTKENLNAYERVAQFNNALVEQKTKNDNIIDVIMKADGAQFNEIVRPLQSTLNTIISFCDMAKHFISDADASDTTDDDDDDDADADDADDDDNDDAVTTNDNTINNVDLFSSSNKNPTTTADLPPSMLLHEDEVQGQRSLSIKTSSLIQAQNRATSSTWLSSSSTSVGSGRGKVKKFKKKLSKFILPLLLAYKLKFLTLIPVLIGGLTLLVGTTGLAGFFFALFTAVMSLKSTGSSKSIIVKKI